MSRGWLVLVLVAAVSFAAAATALAKKIGSATASGDYAIATASGDAKHPHKIKVKVTSSPRQRVDVSWLVVCSKGYGAGSKSGQFHHKTNVTRRLKMPMKHPDDCTIAATAQLDQGGHLKVTLYAH